MIEPLSQKIAIVQAITIAAGAAGATALNGATLDMQAYRADRVLMYVKFGPIVLNAVTSIKAQVSDAANFADPLDIAGSAQTVTDANDDKVFMIDVINPPKRYVRVVVSRATQAATVTADYIIYSMRNRPVTQGADVVGLEVHRNKVTGTA